MPDVYSSPSGGAGLVAPVVPKGESLIDPALLMSAVQQVMNRKERARQFEIELARLSQQDRLQREEHGIQIARLGEEAKYHREEMGFREKELESQDRYRQGSLSLRDAVQDYKEGKDLSTMQDQQGLANEITAIKARQGTAEYRNEFLQALGRHPGAMRGTWGQKLFTDAASDHDKQFKLQQDIFDRELLASGLPKGNAYDALMNPDVWKADPKKPGRQFAVVGKDQLGKDVSVTVPNPTLDRWRETYRALYGGPGTDQPANIPIQPNKTLTNQKAKEYIDKAGGDNAKARQLARADGYEF